MWKSSKYFSFFLSDVHESSINLNSQYAICFVFLLSFSVSSPVWKELLALNQCQMPRPLWMDISCLSAPFSTTYVLLTFLKCSSFWKKKKISTLLVCFFMFYSELQGDRVILGGHHYFRFNHPAEVQSGKRASCWSSGDGHKDFEFAKNELLSAQRAQWVWVWCLAFGNFYLFLSFFLFGKVFFVFLFCLFLSFWFVVFVVLFCLEFCFRLVCCGGVVGLGGFFVLYWYLFSSCWFDVLFGVFSGVLRLLSFFAFVCCLFKVFVCFWCFSLAFLFGLMF